MKVIILAGGFGTRLSEYTDRIPKPMVNIAGKPILYHIMQRYSDFGHKDFYIALGYKAEVIKEYFLNISNIHSDSSEESAIDVQVNKLTNLNWKVTLVDTGKDSMTGGRVKRMQKFIGDEPYMLTYGDGLADIDINKLVNFHKDHGKMVTITAVRPIARFGELRMNGNNVKSFQEKPQVTKGWINGGFFVCQPEFFDLINDDLTILEREPLEYIASKNELMAYKHEGFWQCMDTKRDKDFLERLSQKNQAPWQV
jgi:glucose-1-phosphate cytidylyltransferase